MTLRDHVVDLQCKGARIEIPIKDRGRRGGAGPADGKAFILNGIVTTVPTMGDFTAESPYAVIEKEDGYYLAKNGQPVMPVQFPPTPHFYDLQTKGGIPYRQLALLHGSDTLATTVCQKCIRWRTPGKRCQFCAIEQSLDHGTTVAMKTPEQLAEVCEAAARLDGIGHVVLTTGTTNLRDKGVRYLARCSRAIKERSGIAIQAQFEPPEEFDDMLPLKEAGVDSVGIHMESFDQSVRERFTPGKAEISIERYFDTYERAVQIFGRNQVSTYIIVGLGDTPGQIIEGSRRLASMGVYPFVVPLRPIIGTPMQDVKTPEPSLMSSLYTQLAAINREYGLNWRNSKAGCERCGACSAMPAFED